MPYVRLEEFTPWPDTIYSRSPKITSVKTDTYQGCGQQYIGFAEPVKLTLFQLCLSHKQRGEKMANGTYDNINYFTVLAENKEEVVPLFEQWYMGFSGTGVPLDKYDVRVAPIIVNLTGQLKGVVSFSYCW